MENEEGKESKKEELSLVTFASCIKIIEIGFQLRE